MILNDVCRPCSVQVTQKIEMINKMSARKKKRLETIVSDLQMFEGL